MTPTPATLDVFYSCDLCGLDDARLAVAERPAEMDVRDWMQTVILATARDHHARSPECHPTELKHLKIPLTGRQWIGGPVIQ